MSIKVGICILNHNRKKMLLRCLVAVYKIRYPIGKILVVDNHSTDGSVEAVKTKYPKVKVIENEKNFGPSIGKNIGLQAIMESNMEYVLLIDNDIIVDPDVVTEFVKVAEKESYVGILGPKILNLSRPNEFYGAGCIIDYTQNIGWGRGRGEVDQGQYDRTEEMDCLLGGTMFIQVEALKEVGLFDEKFLGYWYEGQDLCLRMKKGGFKNFYVHLSKVYHKPHVDNYSFKRKYLAARNSIYFMRKHGSIRNWVKYIIFVFIGLGYGFVVEAIRGNIQGVIGKARGLFDGLCQRDGYAKKLLNYDIE